MTQSTLEMASFTRAARQNHDVGNDKCVKIMMLATKMAIRPIGIDHAKGIDFRIRAEAISQNPNSHPRLGRSITRQELKKIQPKRTSSTE